MEHAAAASHSDGTSVKADLEFAIEIAAEAGRIVMSSYERTCPIEAKGARDVVTEADWLSEEFLVGAIRDRHPGDAILAEESGRHEAMAGAKGADNSRTWVLDPLDGTVNFANGIPFFSVSVCLVVNGRPSVGVVVDPARAELFSASEDGPASLNGGPIAVSSKRRLNDCVVGGGLAGRAGAIRLNEVGQTVRGFRSLGSAALSICYVANGRLDAFVQQTGQCAWDLAAAGLIAVRSGAAITDFSGGPWFDLSRPAHAWGVIAAPPSLYPRFADVLHGADGANIDNAGEWSNDDRP